MLDYPALRALAAVVQSGSFEKAAAALGVTPSAISQRIKQLEERVGAALVVRANPCVATPKGEWLCRHMENVGMLETELFQRLPDLADGHAPAQAVTLNIAVNADSLATWFVEAAARFARRSPHLLGVAVDDQDHTAEWLQRGKVVAAVTSLEKPVSGARRFSLGALRYCATASPDFMARHFSAGVTPATLAPAPALSFNPKDGLQSQWVRQNFGVDIVRPTHWLPSSQSFVHACLSGMAWGMNPIQLVEAHLRDGRLVELIPSTPVDVPLYWQVSRLAASQLESLTREVVAAGRRELVQPD